MTDPYGAPAPKPKREPQPKPPVERCCWTCNHARPTLNAAGRRDPHRVIMCTWEPDVTEWPDSYINTHGPPDIHCHRHFMMKQSGADCKCWTPKEKT